MSDSRITIGTYNVCNMFGKEEAERSQGRLPVKSEKSLEALAENIQRADADIVTLQECSTKENLENFLDSHGLDDEYRYVAHVPGNDYRGINVAVISKFPFCEVISHKDAKFPLADGGSQTKFTRDLLRVDLDIDGIPGADLSVYTTHLKSRRPSAPGHAPAEARRLSEGQAVRRIAEEEMRGYPERPFVITGDFNDTAEDASVRAVLSPGGGQEEWKDTLEGIPEPERATWPSNPRKSGGFSPRQFDHIIFPENRNAVLQSSRVHRYEQSQSGDICRVSSTASDHLMLTADFKIFGIDVPGKQTNLP